MTKQSANHWNSVYSAKAPDAVSWYRTEAHQTPWGSQQQFLYCLCRIEAPTP
jgi:hypothetical protein